MIHNRSGSSTTQRRKWPISTSTHGRHQIRDEFGNLALSFNKMTYQLKEANESRPELVNATGARVQEKTRELEKTQSSSSWRKRMAAVGELSAMSHMKLTTPFGNSLLRQITSGIWKGNDCPRSSRIGQKESGLFIGNETKRCGNIVKNLLLFAVRARRFSRKNM